ncbi:DUF2252 family protein [Lichenifustis flavocetrariae]|uniref:DUF2252 domain-containing protein n=1 Tax=Lichenifustis flavocetrariae TaxID=2949735 RepID=A0AA42CNH1_9HYPH|nr:DUF2252 family protein [Lichenifustis flavocetrariae]MCW6512781.1 DUF2252 domain-containing protein [Lichenifustis flavocetrariae]
MTTAKSTIVPFPALSERAAILNDKRVRKMARSAHAYVRGSTAQFYEWLGEIDQGSVPAAPSIWICGDCHAGNLGPVANASGKVRIQIRDLDQTVIGNPAHDLLRLGLSLSAAARGSNLPGTATAHMLEEMIRGYQDALAGHDESLSEARAGKAVRSVLDKATHRRWEHLARERLEHVEPKIPMGKRFWPLADEERQAIETLVTSAKVADLVRSLHGRGEGQTVKVLDSAYWVKGCSSLGTMRYAVLLRIGGEKSDRSYCMIDIKEAVDPLAPVASTMPANLDQAERVVNGARALSPYLGERMVQGRMLGHSVVVRELLPQDLKLDVDQLTVEEAVHAARFLSAVVGHSHARQMTEDVRRAWGTELATHHGRNLDAPSWLWTTIVDLIGTHERAYLEHCRSYALSASERPA